MPTYEYEIEETGEIIEIVHSIKDDPYTEIEHPESGERVKVHRLVSGGTGTIFKGGGWTIGADRGYKGKFKNKLRPKGTPVDEPNRINETVAMHQLFEKTHGDMGFRMKKDTKSQTLEQQLDKNYNPHKK